MGQCSVRMSQGHFSQPDLKNEEGIPRGLDYWGRVLSSDSYEARPQRHGGFRIQVLRAQAVLGGDVAPGTDMPGVVGQGQHQRNLFKPLSGQKAAPMAGITSL